MKRLVVKYNEQIVGYLEELEDKRIAFQYDQAWVLNGFSISPFHLPLTDDVYFSKSKYFDGLFGVFHDSLPNGFGELVMRRMFQEKGLSYDKVSPLYKLAVLNDNALGGLNYLPTFSTNNQKTMFDLDELSKEANDLLNQEYHHNFDSLFRLAGASGGARPKAHVIINNEAWIIKFPSSFDPIDIGKIEYNSNVLAEKLGMNVNQSKMFPSKQCSGYFGAKRFDRIKNHKVHVISLSSLLETTHQIPNLDYTHLFQVITHISCQVKTDLLEAYKRMVFNVLYQNKDDHGKNHSFMYCEDKKGYMLSPFYDITKTPNKNEHEMTVLGVGNPTEKELIQIGRDFNIPFNRCEEIIRNTKKAINLE
jgi:serine/threonine-protein kinase HipA